LHNGESTGNARVNTEQQQQDTNEIRTKISENRHAKEKWHLSKITLVN
jgi:hypothetical protein